MSETGVAQNKRKLPTSTAFVSTGRARQRRKETCIHLEVSKVFPSATSCVPRGGDEYFQNKCPSAHLSLCTDTLTPLGGDRAPPTGTSADSQKYETQNQTYPDTSRNYVRERQCTRYRNVTHCAAVGNQKSYVKNLYIFYDKQMYFAKCKPVRFSGCSGRDKVWTTVQICAFIRRAAVKSKVADWNSNKMLDVLCRRVCVCLPRKTRL